MAQAQKEIELREGQRWIVDDGYEIAVIRSLSEAPNGRKAANVELLELGHQVGFLQSQIKNAIKNGKWHWIHGRE